MKRVSIVMAIVLCLAQAQWLETTIFLPDTMTGLADSRAIVFDSSQKRVYVGGNSGYVMAIDHERSEKLVRIPVPNGAVAMCLDETAGRIYCAGGQMSQDSVLTVIDVATNSVVGAVRVGPMPYILAIAPDRTIYCGNGYGRSVSIIRNDTVAATLSLGLTPTIIRPIPGTGKTYCAAGITSGSSIFVIEGDTIRDSIGIARSPRDIVYCPANGHAYVPSGFEAGIYVIDVAADSVIAVIRLDTTATAAAYDADRDKLYCGLAGGRLSIIDCATNTVLKTMTLPATPGLVISDTSLDRVYCSGAGNAGISVIDCQEDSLVHDIAMPSVPQAMRAVPGFLYAACPSPVCLVSVAVPADTIQARLVFGYGPMAFAYNSQQNRIYVAEYL
ncbi:MAG: hypothetical protein ABIK62_01385, partial [candidate division WOR-3 bacterium]